MSKPLGRFEVWFVCGSQHMYGEDQLRVVEQHAAEVAAALDAAQQIPVRVVMRPIATTPESIEQSLAEANASSDCVGVIAWMHTFSPAKMWITGLDALRRPLLHLHTQLNEALPWESIDMDFMNLNQAAHGDREFGYVQTRIGVARKTVAGHASDPVLRGRIDSWVRAARGAAHLRGLRLARFGDNMRNVAVTEGDKVEAELRLGVSVNTYGVNDLVAVVDAVPASEIDALVATYADTYLLAPELARGGDRHASLRYAARIEAGLHQFLEQGNFGAFTTNFQDLGGLRQLPGLAVQRLMADGYGFGAEGDWKTAALVRTMKVMGSGLSGGTSFMEDYTYDFENSAKVLGAHMLEICPTIAADRPRAEIHPLSIGGKADPVRLVFTAPSGPAVVASVVQMGNRFRMIVNEIDVVPPDRPLPKLPVARAVWKPRPDLATAAAAWIYAGGAHHTGFSQALTSEHVEDYSAMANMEFLCIDAGTRLRDFRNELRWNEAAWTLKGGC